MWTRLGPWCPRAGLLRLLCDDWLLLLGHGCCCHCVSSGTELPIALVLDAELLLLLLLVSNTAATAGLCYVTSAGIAVSCRLQAVPVAALAFPRREDAVARLLLLLLQGCKQRSSLQYENEDRELDQRLSNEYIALCIENIIFLIAALERTVLQPESARFEDSAKSAIVSN